MKCTDLRNEAIKMLGVYFLYNQTINFQKKIYNIISKIQGFLKVVIIIKRLKFAAYLKNKLGSNVVLFLQETNSVSKNENTWDDNFKSQVFFSHGTSNSQGALIA